MFTLHAEHEMNCSTAAARHLASSGVDVYTAIAGAPPLNDLLILLLWMVPLWTHCNRRTARAHKYSPCAGAVGALYGPLHGGANEAVLRMLERIGSVDNIGPFLEGVKNKKEKMFGFGHR